MEIMSNLTKQVIDQIEFYINEDGSFTGLSVRGLARLCGINVSSIKRLLDSIDNKTVAADILKPLQNKDLAVALDDNVKVIDSDTSAVIIEYYAFDSKVSNETALYSFRKFASKGISTWIKDVVGFKDTSYNKDTLSVLNELLNRMKVLEKETVDLRLLKTKTTTVYLGLDKLIDNLIKEEDNLLPPEDKDTLARNYTVTEWLREYKGIRDLDLSFRSKLAIMASQNYKALKGTDPEKGIRRHSNGKINNGVTVYYLEDLPILDLAFNTLFLKK